MIKLVTQFDDVNAQATVSTPSCCACCCCCCCCVASIVSSSAITAMNLKSVTKKNDAIPQGKKNVFPAIGFFALPALLVLTIFLFSQLSDYINPLINDPIAILVYLGVIWGIVLTYLYRLAGAGKKTIHYVALTVVLTGAAFTAEFFAGLYALGSLGLEGYMAVAFLLTTITIGFYSKRNKLISSAPVTHEQ